MKKLISWAAAFSMLISMAVPVTAASTKPELSTLSFAAAATGELASGTKVEGAKVNVPLYQGSTSIVNAALMVIEDSSADDGKALKVTAKSSWSGVDFDFSEMLIDGKSYDYEIRMKTTNGKSKALFTKAGDTQSSSKTVDPIGASNVSAYEVVTVSDVSYASGQTLTIQSQYGNGNYELYVDYVKIYGDGILPDTGETTVKLNKSEYKMDAYNLTECELKATTQNYNGEVAWESSASDVAEVVNGKVTAKAAGTAVITAKAGDAKASCTIEVTDSSVPMAKELANLSTSSNNVLNVGADKEYKTIRAALAQAAALNPKSESERVVINVDPGTYREQVIVKTPYVTIRKTPNTSGTVLMSWYYGTGQKYYSSKGGYYDEASAAARTESSGVSNWGATLQVNANDFVLENVYLENSFNRYLTDEEMTDNAGADTGAFDRMGAIKAMQAAGCSEAYINQWLKSRTSLSNCDKLTGYNSSFRERCAALYTTGDRITVRGCTVVSTQDTIGIMYNRVYFDSCILSGTVDYICGSAPAVINNCELRWNSGAALDAAQSDKDSGHLAVPSMASGNGYVFYNCHVTGNAWSTTGSYGRPWNANGEAVYINTKIDRSKRDGKLLMDAWTGMSASEPEKARFTEYNMIDAATGSVIDSSNNRHSYALNEWSMLKFNPYTQIAGKDGWNPSGLKSVYDEIDKAMNGISFSDNGEGMTVALPKLDGYDLYWETADEPATVSNQNEMTVVRPAYGEEPVAASVKLTARKSGTAYGAEKELAFKIAPMTSNETCGSVTGTLSMSKAYPEVKSFTVKFMLPNGAAVKSAKLEVPVGTTSYAYSIDNIPEGEYSVAVIAEDGMQAEPSANSVKIAAKTDTKLDISAFSTVQTSVTAAKSVDTSKTLSTVDIMAALTDAQRESIKKSDTVTVGYKLHVDESKFNPKGNSYDQANICILGADAPSSLNAYTDNTRYTRMRINGWWKQLDMVDYSADFAGVTNVEDHQILNTAGKFQNVSGGVDYTVSVTIDYKNGVIVQNSSGAKGKSEYTFKRLPTGVTRDKLILAAYNDKEVVYELTDVSVSFEERAAVSFDAACETLSVKEYSESDKAMGFKAVIGNTGNDAGMISELTWTVTSNGVSKSKSFGAAEIGNISLEQGADVVIGLVVNGLADENAVAELSVK